MTIQAEYDVIIETPATGSGNSQDFVVDSTSINVCVYPQSALVDDSEFANLTIKDPAGTYVEVHDSAGQVQLHGANPQVTIVAPGVYRLEWSARTAAIGAFIKS